MKRRIVPLLSSAAAVLCSPHALAQAVSEVSGLAYLSNTTFPTGYRYQGWTVGGLSGIEYDKDKNVFLTVRDNMRNGLGANGAPYTSYFSMTPEFTAGEPGYKLTLAGVTPLDNPAWVPPTDGLESIRLDPDGDGIWLSSESDNVLYRLSPDGTSRETIRLDPLVTGPGGNTQLEGMTFTPNKSLWVIREDPRAEDAGLVRLSKLDKSGKMLAQYAYKIDDKFNNGVSELLALGDDSFLVMERAWNGVNAAVNPTVSSNSIRIYRVSLNGATEVSARNSLNSGDGGVVAVDKTLVFDSQSLAQILNTYDTKIDNIEGMSFGPTLPNGHQSFVLVSDNNFSNSQRKSQFIVFQVKSPIPDDQYWDGQTPMADGQAGGGSGVWSVGEIGKSYENWTREAGTLNDPWNGGTAIFAGQPGQVVIDSRAGAVSARALRFVANGYQLTGDALTVPDAGTLLDVAAPVAVFDTGFQGNGRVTKQGAGQLVMAGTDQFTGGIDVAEGGLIVNGATTSAVNVGAGARLGGDGRIGNLTVASGGTLAPGNSVGTLSVDGDVRFAPGSAYEVEVDPASGVADRLAATGKAYLAGSVVQVAPSAGYSLSSRYSLLTAAEGISGRFDEVRSDFAFLTPALDYSNNAVTLTLERNATGFASVAATPNQAQVAQGVEGLGLGNDLFDAVVMLDPHDARASFGPLSGELSASTLASLSEDSRQVRDVANAHLRAALGGPEADASSVLADDSRQGGGSVWLSGLGSRGSLEGGADIADLNRSSTGMLIGADAPIGGGWRAGAFTGYSHADADLAQARGKSETDSYHLGAFAGTRFNGFGFTTGASYSWHDVESRRSVAIPGLAERLSADYDAQTLQAFSDLGYAVGLGAVTVEPFVNLAYAQVKADAHSERGGAAALHTDGESFDTTFATSGIRASGALTAGTMPVSWHGQLGWLNNLGDKTPSVTQRFAGSDAAFDVAGTSVVDSALTMAAGVDVALSADTHLGLNYRGQFDSAAKDRGLDVALNWRF